MLKMWITCISRIKENNMLAAALILTCFCAIYDIRKKEIPLLPMILGIIFALIAWIWRILTGKAELTELFSAVLPGIFLLVIGLCSKEKIGFGDGILLVMIGLMIGFPLCLGVLCIGLIGSCLYALFLLVFRKAKRGDSFPFAPFLAVAVGVCMIV